jgi:teichuronic acid biosynthesis glycosyltransferase TuaG
MEIDNNSTNISVIIPCHNSGETILRALSSVCRQTIKPKELIIVDDSSSDNTSGLLKDFSNQEHDFPVILINNDLNLGAGLSRNKGWDIASGDWVSFLDSDDAWLENKLEMQIDFVRNIPEVDVISFKSGLFSKNNKFGKTSSGDFHKLKFHRMLFRNQVVTRTVAVRSSISNRFPIGLSEDYGLWLELLAEGFNIFKVENVVALTFRPEFSKGGVSSQLVKHEFFEIKRLFAHITKSPFFVSLAIPFSVVKFMRRICISTLRNIHR